MICALTGSGTSDLVGHRLEVLLILCLRSLVADLSVTGAEVVGEGVGAVVTLRRETLLVRSGEVAGILLLINAIRPDEDCRWEEEPRLVAPIWRLNEQNRWGVHGRQAALLHHTVDHGSSQRARLHERIGEVLWLIKVAIIHRREALLFGAESELRDERQVAISVLFGLIIFEEGHGRLCLLYTSPSPRD